MNIHVHVFVFLNTSFHPSRINAQEYNVLGLIEMEVSLRNWQTVSTVAILAMFLHPRILAGVYLNTLQWS